MGWWTNMKKLRSNGCGKRYQIMVAYMANVKKGMYIIGMNVALRRTTPHDHRALVQLMQFFLYEMSDINAQDVDRYGRFGTSSLQPYFLLHTTAAFLIIVDGRIGGFVLVGTHSLLEPHFRGHSCLAFFVMKRYRRCGVGRAAATQLFTMLPGQWEIATFATHTVGHAFWRSVLDSYTNGAYKERWLQAGSWRGYVQSFATTP